MYTYANGIGGMSMEIEVQEIQRFKGLEQQYNIKIAPINFPGSKAYDFVYIDSETIIVVNTPQLIEINLLTKEQKTIELPAEYKERKLDGYRGLQYDPVTNSIHMTFLYRRADNRSRQSYHILRLEDYTWEAIDELGDQVRGFWYDSKNMFIYANDRGTITVFDLRKREVLDYIEMPNEVKNVVCMYGNPLKVLISINTILNNESRFHYIIFDTATGTSTNFLESTESIIDSKINFHAFIYYTPVNDDNCFLGVDRRSENKSGMVLLDLQSNIIETVALDDFPYEIYNFKQIAEGKYGFMMGTRTVTGAHGQSFLCFLDYP
jgi:hypothetical protein